VSENERHDADKNEGASGGRSGERACLKIARNPKIAQYPSFPLLVLLLLRLGLQLAQMPGDKLWSGRRIAEPLATRTTGITRMCGALTQCRQTAQLMGRKTVCRAEPQEHDDALATQRSTQKHKHLPGAEGDEPPPLVAAGVIVGCSRLLGGVGGTCTGAVSTAAGALSWCRWIVSVASYRPVLV